MAANEIQGAEVDVVLVLSENEPEPTRADWIATELNKRGLRVALYRYELGELNLSPQSEARIVVLFSQHTPRTTVIGYIALDGQGRRPLPVKVEACQPSVILAPLRFAQIYGASKDDDLEELQLLIEAIVS